MSVKLTLRKVLWDNKWTSAVILLAVCASFVISYHIYNGSMWNITESEELAMSMTVPAIIFILYLIFRMTKEGLIRPSASSANFSDISTSKPPGVVRQLFSSFLVSIIVFLFFLLIGFPVVDFTQHILFYSDFIRDYIPQLVWKVVFFANLILLFWAIIRWVSSVALSVKARGSEVARKSALKRVFSSAVLIGLFSISQLVFLGPLGYFFFLSSFF